MTISIDQITDTNIDGTGVFDKYMTTFLKHIKSEYAAERINKSDYATSYLRLMELASSTSLQLVLQQEINNAQVLKIEADTALVDQQKLKSEKEVLILAKELLLKDKELVRADKEIEILDKDILIKSAQVTAMAKDLLLTTAKISNMNKDNDLKDAQIIKMGKDVLLAEEQINIAQQNVLLEIEKIKLIKKQILESTAKITLMNDEHGRAAAIADELVQRTNHVKKQTLTELERAKLVENQANSEKYKYIAGAAPDTAIFNQAKLIHNQAMSYRASITSKQAELYTSIYAVARTQENNGVVAIAPTRAVIDKIEDRLAEFKT